MKKIISFIVSAVLVFSCVANAGAVNTENSKLKNSTAAFDLTNVNRQEKSILLPNGETGTIVLEKVATPVIMSLGDYSLHDGEWKIYFYGVGMNTSYYIDINNSKITNARDLWYLGIGWNVNSASLSYTSTKSTARYEVTMNVAGVDLPVSTVFRLNAKISGSRLITEWV